MYPAVNAVWNERLHLFLHWLLSFPKPSQAQEWPGERELSCLGVEELAATRAVFPYSAFASLGVLGPNSLESPFGWIPCLLKKNNVRKTLPRYNYYHIWSSNGFYRKQYKIFLCLALPIFIYKNVHVKGSISFLTNSREGKKKEKERVKVTALTISL